MQMDRPAEPRARLAVLAWVACLQILGLGVMWLAFDGSPAALAPPWVCALMIIAGAAGLLWLLRAPLRARS
jgi:hypothetical protein